MRTLFVILLVLGVASVAVAMSPEEFDQQWSKDHYVQHVEKMADMLQYSVKSYHTYHIRVTRLKVKTNPLSDAWVVKRIVEMKPDAAIVYLKHRTIFGYREMPAACVVLRSKTIEVVWRTEDISKQIVNILLRLIGVCNV